MRGAAIAALSAIVLLSGAARAGTPDSSAITATTPEGALEHPLSVEDLNTWLDGYMPYALKSGDIAGAVVVVVKDGKILTERGYGYANLEAHTPVDPAKTLFRPGSTAKLLTWTAVMQLVEAGKVDLDRDVNAYLDFSIPPYEGKPVTLRELMTHTGGFEEQGKHLFIRDPAQLISLESFVKVVPDRILAPGTVPAYSNYGAALAGYIVQRVSGEPFASYIEHRIFQPLGMLHSTFEQPLPKEFEAGMSTGYLTASTGPRLYEYIGPAPAGSLASTGDDMARFMIAHLQDGRYASAKILSAATAQLMHKTAFVATPPLPGMALGFYHEDRNGHVIIGHAGDTAYFHSDLHLFVDDGSGLFISMNSLGQQGAARIVREQLFREFADRYYPQKPERLATLSTAARDAVKMVGNYILSRRAESSFLRISYLLPQSVEALADGTIAVSTFQTPAGAVKRWREIAPFVWQEVNGESRLAAVLKDGHVAEFASDDLPQATIFLPEPASMNASWNVPLLVFSVAVLVLTALLWPISALVRWYYGKRLELTVRAKTLQRLARLAAIVDLVLVVGWLMVIGAVSSSLTVLNDPLDTWLRLLQLVGIFAIIGAVVAVLNLAEVWQDGQRGRWAKVCAVALACACGSVVWFIVCLRLITVHLNY